MTTHNSQITIRRSTTSAANPSRSARLSPPANGSNAREFTFQKFSGALGSSPLPKVMQLLHFETGHVLIQGTVSGESRSLNDVSRACMANGVPRLAEMR